MNKMKVISILPWSWGDWETVTKCNEHGLWSQTDLALPPTRWMTLGKSLYLSEPQYLCLKRAQ